MIDVIGWLGTFCFSLCGLPQAVKCYREKKADGLSPMFLWLWILGEVFSLIYVWSEHFSWPLVVNYAFNLFLILFMLRYVYWPATDAQR